MTMQYINNCFNQNFMRGGFMAGLDGISFR